MLKLRLNTLFVLFVLSLSTSCSSYLNYFETAQGAFNQAARTENALKASPNTNPAVSVESQYRMARTYAMKAMGDIKDKKEKHNKTSLAGDGLLLNAYTIKGLSEWKLGMYTEALATSKACMLSFQSDKSVQTQRDYVVMMCLEALIYNDSIEAYISRLEPEASKSELTNTDVSSLENLQKAFQIFSSERSKLDIEHPIQRYLIISQLSAAKNWDALKNKLTQQLRSGNMEIYNSKYKAKWASEKEKMDTMLKTVFEDFAKVLPQGKNAPLYKKWTRALSF